MCSGCRDGRKLGPRCTGGQLGRTGGFTIVEVLVAMAIILVLAGLILATSSYVSNKGARSRAEVEIAAMSAALENYKTDYGVYPSDITIDARTIGDPAQYQTASATLFKNLSGDLNGDGQSDPGVTSYMAFKPNQTGGTTAPFFVKDPFGNSYGYSTIFQTDSTKGYNPTFDLWSTAGTSTTGTPKPVPWVKNW
jgi:prepilin-type N-terminal cleavage/methylation domain-containing protein